MSLQKQPYLTDDGLSYKALGSLSLAISVIKYFNGSNTLLMVVVATNIM